MDRASAKPFQARLQLICGQEVRAGQEDGWNWQRGKKKRRAAETKRSPRLFLVVTYCASEGITWGEAILGPPLGRCHHRL